MGWTKKNWLKEAVVILIMAAISLTVLYPMLGSFSSKLPYAYIGDVRLSVSILCSNLDKIAHGQWSQIYHLPILFPLSFTMTAGVNLFGQTLLLLPLYLSGNTNIYLWYNLLTLLSFIAAGYCAYLLIREFTASRAIAAALGAVYMLLPPRVFNIPHLNLLVNFTIPLAFLFFCRFLKRGRGLDLAWLCGSLLLQFLFDLSLGFFLTISLGLFFLCHLLLDRPRQRIGFYLMLAGAALVVLLILGAIFQPYLNQSISHSYLPEGGTIERIHYSQSLGFYINVSYILLALKPKMILWALPSQSAGLAASLLFLLAFWPALASRFHKILFGAVAFFLVMPVPLMIVLFRRIPLVALRQVGDAAFGSFLAAFALLLWTLRRRLPAAIRLLGLCWLALLFFSSQLCLQWANLFGLLSHLFPFLLRTRGIRTDYIVSLLFLAIAAFGFLHLWRGRRHGRILFAVLALLLFAERLRWPIIMGSFGDEQPGYRHFYRQLDSLPEHFGILELPLYLPSTNHYSLYTRFHSQHTYHGMLGPIWDLLELQGAPHWGKSSGFSSLADAGALAQLRHSGIRVIMIFRDKVEAQPPADARAWPAILANVRRGQELGLYQKVNHSREGIVLVLSGREEGRAIGVTLPYFSLVRARRLRFDLVSEAGASVSLRFNGQTIARCELEAGKMRELSFDISGLALKPEENRLELSGSGPLALDDLRLER